MRKKPAIGFYEPRAIRPKLSIAFDPDTFEAIRSEAETRKVSAAQVVRELCKATLRERTPSPDTRGEGR